jgi:hypothetical protein
MQVVDMIEGEYYEDVDGDVVKFVRESHNSIMLDIIESHTYDLYWNRSLVLPLEMASRFKPAYNYRAKLEVDRLLGD